MSTAPAGAEPPKKERWKIGDQLSADQKQQLEALLAKHREDFAFSVEELGSHTKFQFEFELQKGTKPIFRQPHRLSQFELDFVEKKCQELLEVGLIRESRSEFAAATVLPKKKDANGNYTDRRMCGDYRLLNDVTVADKYQMPMVESILMIWARPASSQSWTSGKALIRSRSRKITRSTQHSGGRGSCTNGIVCHSG